MLASLTPKEINKINEQFWARQNRLTAQRMASEHFRELALNRIRLEQLRVPAYSQITLEAALEEVERSAPIWRSQLAREGGRADKPDALQKLILDYVRTNPKITEPELRAKLTRDRHPSVISDVDEEAIEFDGPSSPPSPVAIPNTKKWHVRSYRLAFKDNAPVFTALWRPEERFTINDIIELLPEIPPSGTASNLHTGTGYRKDGPLLSLP